jgi:hypothetical protein
VSKLCARSKERDEENVIVFKNLKQQQEGTQELFCLQLGNKEG